MEAFMSSATVVICAYTEERWVTLHRAVDVVRKQIGFDDELLVVVDHNESLLARCRAAIADCKVVPNSHMRGLSGARNTALETAQGSIVIFLDDDAIPFDGWLDALRTPYSDECVYGVGGFARPRWVNGKPDWFPDEFLWVVGCSHLGLPSTTQPVRNFIGANMSFRRAALENLGGFAESMGRVDDRPLGCEETEFCIRLTQANADAILLYNPSAKVEHYVTEKRGSVRYFARRCWAEGLSKAEVARRVGQSSALSAERSHALRILPRGIWRGFRDSSTGDLWGVARAAAIVTGLFITTAGYTTEHLRAATFGKRR
jgi:glycosyltransferase involved in cell wall biosynthesis